MPTHPYLHFNGTCAEALAFYADVLGGTEPVTMRYADGADAPADWAGTDRVMHGQIGIAEGTLMASDSPPGTTGEPQTSVSVYQAMDSRGAAATAFARFAEGGEVIAPFDDSFFADGFGMVTDRFGTHWILTGPPLSPPAG